MRLKIFIIAILIIVLLVLPLLADEIHEAASKGVVSPDCKYLFFISRRNGVEGIYRVDAKIIEDFKTKDLK
jgi:hypothetical protein